MSWWVSSHLDLTPGGRGDNLIYYATNAGASHAHRRNEVEKKHGKHEIWQWQVRPQGG